MPPPILNPTAPLTYTYGDTSPAIQIQEPNWNLSGASAVVIVEGQFIHLPIAPFSGDTNVTVTQPGSGAGSLQYAWPSALPVGFYLVYFKVTDAGGKIRTTGAVQIIVTAA